jgi:hypothetical protein
MAKPVIDQRSHTPAITGYERWLAGGGIYEESAVARISELMFVDAQGRSDATGRFRPSMAGDQCVRRQMLSYRGVPNMGHDIGSMAYMVNGTFGHYRWQMAGLSEGFLDSIEVPLKNSHGVKGSGDGLLAADGSLFELKTTMSRIYNKILASMHPKDDHVLQVVWMTLESDIEWVSIVYEDRDYPMRRLELRVNVGDTDPSYPSLQRKAIKRLDELNAHAEAGTLPEMLPECASQVGDVYRSCPWRKACPLQD